MKTKPAAHTPTYPGIVVTKTTLSVNGGQTFNGWPTIVRAVNAHEELVDIANSCLANCVRLSEMIESIKRKKFDPTEETLDWIKTEADRTIEDVKQSLAKAEGVRS